MAQKKPQRPVVVFHNSRGYVEKIIDEKTQKEYFKVFQITHHCGKPTISRLLWSDEGRQLLRFLFGDPKEEWQSEWDD